MSEIMDAYWQAPPMARTLATAILVTSLSAYIFGILSFSWLYFSEDRLFRLPPEIWRLVTSFLISGPKLGIIMDPYFGRALDHHPSTNAHGRWLTKIVQFSLT